MSQNINFSVHAQTVNEDGDINLSGIVPGPPPSIPAVITEPDDGDKFKEDPTITVSGTCEAGYIVEVYRNNAFSGSATCTSGNFSLQITLTEGGNDLLARTRDTIGQYGPNSTTVTVDFKEKKDKDEDNSTDSPDDSSTDNDDGGGESESESEAIPPPLVATEPLLQGAQPGSAVSLPYEINGGKAPYTVTINWGDGIIDTFVIEEAGDYEAQHTYAEPGQYAIVITIVDAEGKESVIQTIVVVNGEAVPKPSESACPRNRCSDSEFFEQLFSRWWGIPVVATVTIGTISIGYSLIIFGRKFFFKLLGFVRKNN